jgi:hypothetical protein
VLRIGPEWSVAWFELAELSGTKRIKTQGIVVQVPTRDLQRLVLRYFIRGHHFGKGGRKGIAARTAVIALPLMPTDHIVALLITERDKLNRAIEALQGPAKHRGRPPKNPLATAIVAPAAPTYPPKRPRRTAAQRKAQAERMKAYWAKRKKEKG